jgi:hypothetical protein
MTTTPRTIPEYLEQLRAALRGADPALIQDALYDAEEYLRSELAANPGTDEATLLAGIAGSYGAPEEVADIYRDTEVQVTRALRAPPPAAADKRGTLARFFGVIADPYAWTGFFYMLLSLATGIVYFTTVVTGFSVSAGTIVLIIGIPIVILFVGVIRILSLVEGRIVEVMLGERMPRRPLYQGRGQPWLQRIVDMFTDLRTWSTMLYMLLMLPLGTLYFTVAVTGMSTSLGLVLGSVLALLQGMGLDVGHFDIDLGVPLPLWLAIPVCFAGGLLGFFLTLHIARLVARVHGVLAKHLLVKTAQY